MKIISGGQTGVDRAALDVAIERQMAWGGWCPKGGWAEDLPNPPGLLAEVPEAEGDAAAASLAAHPWNVRDSDATLIITDHDGLSVSIGTSARITVRIAMPSRCWWCRRALPRLPIRPRPGCKPSASASART